jgi:hypothetical protein
MKYLYLIFLLLASYLFFSSNNEEFKDKITVEEKPTLSNSKFLIKKSEENNKDIQESVITYQGAKTAVKIDNRDREGVAVE